MILLCIEAPAALAELKPIAATLAVVSQLLKSRRAEGAEAPPVLPVLTKLDLVLGSSSPESLDAKAVAEREVQALKSALEASQISAPRPIACASRPEPQLLAALADEIYVRLPDAAQVETARAFPVSRDKKREVARLVVHRASTIAVTIGLAPVPFSDAIILVPLQGLMVTAVAYIGGQPWDARAAAEWVASIGVLGAAAMGLRWGAQQLVKLVPGAGTLLSASVAGTGTLAMGRSAIAYFIDGPGLRRPRALLPEHAG